MEKKIRIDAMDYALLQEAKKKKAGLDKENMKFTRLQSIEINELRIKQHQRAKAFKEDQVNKGVSLEKHTEFLDDKKPIFYLENEIAEFDLQINRLLDQNKRIQEEMDKDENPQIGVIE